MEQHTDDILALAITNDRRTVVTGQVGSAPVLFTWDAATGEKKQRFKLTKGARGVNAVAFSEDGSLVACSALDNEHSVYVFDANSGALQMKSSGDTNKIFDIAFSNEPGSKDFATAGVKHFYMWNAAEGAGSKKKGLFGSYEMTSFSCVIFDDKGRAFAGGSNGSVYVFQERNCIGKIDCHKEGFISALTWAEGFIWSGGKDGQVCKIDGDLSG
jgi:echinoderm microtubule-associated protein-like 6